MSYIDLIKEKARADRKTIVLPETNDKRTLIAASHIMKEKIADIIMVGNEEKIMDGARWTMSRWSIRKPVINLRSM